MIVDESLSILIMISTYRGDFFHSPIYRIPTCPTQVPGLRFRRFKMGMSEKRNIVYNEIT